MWLYPIVFDTETKCDVNLISENLTESLGIYHV